MQCNVFAGVKKDAILKANLFFRIRTGYKVATIFSMYSRR